MSRPPIHEKLEEAALLVRRQRQLVEREWEETEAGDVAGLVATLSAVEGELKLAAVEALKVQAQPPAPNPHYGRPRR